MMFSTLVITTVENMQHKIEVFPRKKNLYHNGREKEKETYTLSGTARNLIQIYKELPINLIEDKRREIRDTLTNIVDENTIKQKMQERETELNKHRLISKEKIIIPSIIQMEREQICTAILIVLDHKLQNDSKNKRYPNYSEIDRKRICTAIQQGKFKEIENQND